MSKASAKVNVEPRHGLKPPQFGLRSLLAMMGAVCAVLAIGKAFGMLAGAIAILFALSVTAHIAGNYLGTQLRNSGSAAAQRQPKGEVKPRRCQPAANDFAPATRLRHRAPLGFWLLLALVGMGVAVGMSAGASWLVAKGGEQIAITNLALGAVVFGVLGGMGGFVLGGFAYVLYGAAREAHLHSHRPPS